MMRRKVVALHNMETTTSRFSNMNVEDQNKLIPSNHGNWHVRFQGAPRGGFRGNNFQGYQNYQGNTGFVAHRGNPRFRGNFRSSFGKAGQGFQQFREHAEQGPRPFRGGRGQPYPQGQSGFGRGDSKWFNCGDSGHFKRNCPKPIVAREQQENRQQKNQ